MQRQFAVCWLSPRRQLAKGCWLTDTTAACYKRHSMKILDVPQSGSVGNRTSSRNRSGQYIRQRSLPVQPRTPAQVNARARLSDVSAAWRGLTDAQRANWIAFGQSFTVVNSLGQTINLTGSQCYIKVNTVNLLNGDATVTAPPALPTFVACTVTGIDATAGTPLVELSGANPAAGTKFMIYASGQLSAGVNFNGVYRYLTTNQTFASGKLSLTTVYSAKFGAPIAGKKIFCKVVQSQAGMQDNGTLFTCIVGA